MNVCGGAAVVQLQTNFIVDRFSIVVESLIVVRLLFHLAYCRTTNYCAKGKTLSEDSGVSSLVV